LSFPLPQFTSRALPHLTALPHIALMQRVKILRTAITSIFLVAVASVPLPALAAQITPGALAAFDRYVHLRESQSQQEIASGQNFLSIDTQPQRDREKTYAALKRGEVVVLPTQSCGPQNCPDSPGALIHDWTAIAFIPGVTLPQALTTLQDYNRAAENYSPQVLRSRLLSRNGDDFRVYLRLRQKRILTVVFDTEYDIHYATIDATHAVSTSHSTRIAEISDPGTRDEHALAPVDDHGFLWRLNSYWRFYQADGGIYLQCNAISLTRDVPATLRWMLGRFIENISRESLTFTLGATRQALLRQFPGAAGAPTSVQPRKQSVF
jgi:hypothetical protein